MQSALTVSRDPQGAEVSRLRRFDVGVHAPGRASVVFVVVRAKRTFLADADAQQALRVDAL